MKIHKRMKSGSPFPKSRKSKPADKNDVNFKYWTPCKGCKDGHPSFWKTVIESEQWKVWEKDIAKRFRAADKDKPIPNVWDVDECRECGMISQRHFQAFLNFCATIKAERRKK